MKTKHPIWRREARAPKYFLVNKNTNENFKTNQNYFHQVQFDDEFLQRRKEGSEHQQSKMKMAAYRMA